MRTSYSPLHTQSSESSSQHSQGPCSDATTHLNTGFLSPTTSNEGSLHHQITFSPSIFLSRPLDLDRVTTTANLEHSMVTSGLVLTSNPSSEGECATNAGSRAGVSKSFITSTPIKENQVSSPVGSSTLWSPGVSHASGRMCHLSDTSEVCLSQSELSEGC